MPGRQASAGLKRFDIGKIVRRHCEELVQRGLLNCAQQRVLSSIASCRTAVLGGHILHCNDCGYEQSSYNSCRDRHCPKCQGLAQEAWVRARRERMLPVGHFHLVFTLPKQLRRLARYSPTSVYDALMSTAAETLLAFFASNHSATPGITSVLHTWSRQLSFHPHVHFIVTAGGLSSDNSSWVPTPRGYLFNVKALGNVLRAKMLCRLNKLYDGGKFHGFDDFDDPQGFERLMQQVSSLKWVVYAKKPFGNSLHVLDYLGRYTHRVAISNSRLRRVTDESVTFTTRNGGVITLDSLEFVRRFAQHVLPPHFHKIRHFGLYSAVAARENGTLQTARDLLPTPKSDTTDDTSLGERQPMTHCPKCGGQLERRPLPRAPPLWFLAA